MKSAYKCMQLHESRACDCMSKTSAPRPEPVFCILIFLAHVHESRNASAAPSRTCIYICMFSQRLLRHVQYLYIGVYPLFIFTCILVYIHYIFVHMYIMFVHIYFYFRSASSATSSIYIYVDVYAMYNIHVIMNIHLPIYPFVNLIYTLVYYICI